MTDEELMDNILMCIVIVCLGFALLNLGYAAYILSTIL